MLFRIGKLGQRLEKRQKYLKKLVELLETPRENKVWSCGNVDMLRYAKRNRIIKDKQGKQLDYLPYIYNPDSISNGVVGNNRRGDRVQSVMEEEDEDEKYEVVNAWFARSPSDLLGVQTIQSVVEPNQRIGVVDVGVGEGVVNVDGVDVATQADLEFSLKEKADMNEDVAAQANQLLERIKENCENETLKKDVEFDRLRQEFFRVSQMLEQLLTYNEIDMSVLNGIRLGKTDTREELLQKAKEYVDEVSRFTPTRMGIDEYFDKGVGTQTGGGGLRHASTQMDSVRERRRRYGRTRSRDLNVDGYYRS